jgi:hypothetical protein
MEVVRTSSLHPRERLALLQLQGVRPSSRSSAAKPQAVRTGRNALQLKTPPQRTHLHHGNAHRSVAGPRGWLDQELAIYSVSTTSACPSGLPTCSKRIDTVYLYSDFGTTRHITDDAMGFEIVLPERDMTHTIH